jgi:hypothetical protein
LIAGLVAAAVASVAAKDSAPSADRIHAAVVKPPLAPPSFATLPVAFVENRGQTDAAVRYYAQGDRYGFYFTDRAMPTPACRTNRLTAPERLRFKPIWEPSAMSRLPPIR